MRGDWNYYSYGEERPSDPRCREAFAAYLHAGCALRILKSKCGSAELILRRRETFDEAGISILSLGGKSIHHWLPLTAEHDRNGTTP